MNRYGKEGKEGENREKDKEDVARHCQFINNRSPFEREISCCLCRETHTALFPSPFSLRMHCGGLHGRGSDVGPLAFGFIRAAPRCSRFVKWSREAGM